MEVTFQPMPIIKRVAVRTKIYEVKQDSGFERVLLDGTQIGLVPNNPDDPNYTVLHPLSMGLPQELLQQVVANSKGRLTRTLRGPKPLPPDALEEDEDQDDES